MTEVVQTGLIFFGLSFLGYGVLRWPRSTQIQHWERLVLGLVVMLGLVPLVLFFGLLAGRTLNFIPVWLLAIGALLGLGLWGKDLYHTRRTGPWQTAPRLRMGGSALQIALIAFVMMFLIERFVFAGFQGFLFPTYFWDAVENWNYRAKIFFSTERLNLDPGSAMFLGGGKSHYPPGPSLFRAWTATLVGRWSEPVVAAHSIVVYLLFFGMIWIRLATRIGQTSALFLAYLAVSLPLMAYHAYAGYADLLLSLLLTGCLIYGYEFITTRDTLSGLVSALLLAGCLFIKNEGIVLFLPVIIATMAGLLWSRQLSAKSAALYLGIAIIWILPWVALKAYFGLPYAPTESNSGFAIHFEGLRLLFSVLFLQGSFNLFGVFLVSTAWLFAPVWWRTEVRWLALPVFLLISAILAVFLFTKNYDFLENQMTINRTLLIWMPTYIYLVGVSAARKWGGKDSEGET